MPINSIAVLGNDPCGVYWTGIANETPHITSGSVKCRKTQNSVQFAAERQKTQKPFNE